MRILRWENWSSIKIEKSITKMAMESAIFRQKDTDPSNYIISRFTHFKQTFWLQNQKKTILPH